MFVNIYFNDKIKNDTLIMTREIQHSFRELLNATTWIDDETKVLAGDKVDSMMLKIGYPGFILNTDELNEMYKEVEIYPEKYFENTLNILQHLTKIEQARYITKLLSITTIKTYINLSPCTYVALPAH